MSNGKLILSQMECGWMMAAMFALGLAPVILSQTLPAGPADGQFIESSVRIDNGAELANAAFERFKQLDGDWIGRSTKGWEEKISFKTIAKGSVVVENSFDAHPNETMMTMFYLDIDRLLLTHYCVARSQPRLEATTIEDGGRTITFTFLDATNLPSRDKGHMDKAVFRFIDEDHFTTQWTWYQEGKESWMEKIELERTP